MQNRSSSTQWKNWAGNQTSTVAGIYHPGSLEELQETVVRLTRAGQTIRAVGTGHSWSALVPTSGALINTTHLNRCIELTDEWIHVEGGMLACGINKIINSKGKMVNGLTIYEGMTIGGMVSTGSHGSGFGHGSLSDQVIEMTIVQHDGEIVRITENDREMCAARISLGMLGIIYSVKLRLVPSSNMHTCDIIVPLEDGLSQMMTLAETNDHVSVYCVPYTQLIWFYIANRTDKPINFGTLHRFLNDTRQYVWFWGISSLIGAFTRKWPKATYPLLKMARGFLRDQESIRSYRDAYHYLATFPNLVDSEFVFDRECGEEGYRFILDKITNFCERERYPINMALHARFVQGSDAFLSPTAGRDSVCLEAATAPGESTQLFYRVWGDCMMKGFDARPHWGKSFSHVDWIRQKYASTLPLFEEVRQQFDPEGFFLNKTTRRLLGIQNQVLNADQQL